MLDETRLEGIALSASKTAVNALIETQVILQLMVKKGLVTPGEVLIIRETVARQPKYKQLLEAAEAGLARVDENKKFEDLVEKSLRPGGNKDLTDEEREYILNKLDDITKGVK